MKVLLVTNDISPGNQVIAMLNSLGHDVTAVRSAKESMRALKKDMPDLVLVDIDVEGGSGFNVSRSILNERPLPIVLLIEPKDEILAKDEKASGALAYSVKPIEQEQLQQTVELAISRFEELTILRKEAMDIKEALEGRRLVGKAKAALMRRFEITESEAFRRLKQESASQGRKLKEVAEAVLLAEKLL